MGIGIDNNDIQGSAWGAAFRDKPIMLKTTAEVTAFLGGRIMKNVVLNEDTCTLSTNNSYRNRNTTYEVRDSEKGSTFLVQRNIALRLKTKTGRKFLPTITIKSAFMFQKIRNMRRQTQ